VLNNRYRGTPSVVFVRGLAQALETTTDYLLGLSDEPQPGAMAFLRRYMLLVGEEQLLARFVFDKIKQGHPAGF
jgi:hypothetical protein